MTLVTATIRDIAGNTYANALVEASFLSNIAPETGSGPPLVSGSVFQTFAVTEADSFGSISFNLTDLAVITPTGGSWFFNVLNNNRTIGFSLNSFAVTGVSVDLTAAFQAASAPLFPPTGFGNITVTGLTDTGLANLNGGGNLSGTFTGNPAFSGNPKFSGNVTAGNFNNILYVDGVKYAQTDAGVRSALADAITLGGAQVVIPSGVAITKTSQWLIGNGTTKPPVELELGIGANINDNTTGGVDSFVLGDGCGIVGHGGITAFSATFQASAIKLSATTNINSLVAPASRAGTQEGLYLRCIQVLGNASATITSALFDIQGVFINTFFEDINTNTIPAKVLRIRAGSTTLKICSDLMFYNCNFDCTNAAGGIPVSIEGASASEIANITFIGGGIQHAGNNQSLVNIDGNGVANGAHHIAFIRVHLETQGTPGTNTVLFKDTNHVLFLNCRVSGPVATNVFTLAQTIASGTHDIQIQQAQITTTPTTIINNTINSNNITSANWGIDLLSYQYAGVTASDSVSMPIQTKNYTSTGDATLGGIHLVPLTPANNTMTAITSAASNGSGYAAGSPLQAFAGLYFEGAAAFGTRAHIGTTNSFGTGSQRGFTLDENGNILLVRGKVTQFNAINTVGNGVPAEYATIDLTGQTANIGSTLIYNVPASGAGTYRITVYTIVTSVGTTSTLPAVNIQWTDRDNNTAQNVPFTGTDSGNALTTVRINQFPISAKASTAINFTTTGYASTGSAMQYAVRIKLEAL